MKFRAGNSELGSMFGKPEPALITESVMEAVEVSFGAFLDAATGIRNKARRDGWGEEEAETMGLMVFASFISSINANVGGGAEV